MFEKLRSGRVALGICASLFAATAILFWPACRNGYVNFDDDVYVTANPHVLNGLNAQAVAWAPTTFHASNWHPLTWWSLQLDAQCFGPEASGFHRSSVLLHAANAVLLFLALQLLTGALWRSALVAALFAVHPMRVESVAWVAERKDVLSGFFFLGTLVAYACYAARPTPGRYVSVFMGLALGLMAKPMLVTLPYVLLLLDCWPLGRLASPWVTVRGVVLEKLPLLALALGSALLTLLAQHAVALRSLAAVPVSERAANALVSCAAYLGQTCWPVKLAVFYPYLRDELTAPSVAAAALLLATLTGVSLWQARRRPCLPVGWFWFLGTLAPVIGLIQIGDQARADRYLYIPQIGLFLAVAWVLGELAGARRWATGVCVVLSAAAVAACAVLTTGQLKVWRDGRSLWTHALAVTRNNHVAHAHLADLDVAGGRKAAAIEHVCEAIRLRPGNAHAEQGVAELLIQLHRPQEALPHYREAVGLTPRDTGYRLGLASLLANLHRGQESQDQFRQVLSLDPRCPHAYAGLGYLALGDGQLDAAAADFSQAAALDRSYLAPLARVAMELAGRGRYEAAARVFTQAIATEPQSAQLRGNRGKMFAAAGDWADALADYRAAAGLAPKSTSYRFYVAHAMSKTGHAKQAAEEYAVAVSLAPRWPEQAAREAWRLATDPDPAARCAARAVQLAEQASEARGGKRPELLDVVAAAYAEAGRFGEAVATATEAAALADAAAQGRLAAAIRARLQLYRGGKPCRNPGGVGEGGKPGAATNDRAGAKGQRRG